MLALWKTTLETLTVEHIYSLKSNNAIPGYIFQIDVCLWATRTGKLTIYPARVRQVNCEIFV